VYAQHGKDKVAFELFEDMQGRGIAPDRLTFSSILSMCANQGLLFEGKRIQELFKNRGFQPDKVVGSALISLYGKCGSLTEAEDVFNSMPEQDVVLWNSLITAFSQNGQGEYALELFRRMQRKQIRPSSITFISVLSACSHVGLLDEAYHHFASMEEWYGITPVVDHYNCMIDLLSRAGRLDDAEELLNAMTVKPTASSLMALLGACRNILDHVRGQRIAEKAFLIDPANPSPYVILSSIYAAASEVQDAMNVMMTMMMTTAAMIQEHAGIDCSDGYGAGILGHANNNAELRA
jgi:pentatricopeptide repeat protein